MIGQPKKVPVLDSVVGVENLPTEKEFYIKAMLGGPTGSGKTQSAGTLPKSQAKPALLLDFDNRWETLREEIESGLIKLLELYDEDPDSPKAWDRVESLRHELWALVRKGEFPYSGIIEDGLSQMARLAMNSALTLDPKKGLGGAPAMQHYMPQITYLVKHINSMRNLPCHYILNAHFDLITDESDGRIKILPKVTKSLRTEVASWFNEVYRCYREAGKEGKVHYFWETAGTGKYEFFKSTMNNKQKYWKDPIAIDFDKALVGFEDLVKRRFK